MDDIAASVYPEQSPETRAERALNVLYAFKEREQGGMTSEEVEEAIGDLLTDLHHLADTISPSTWRDSWLMGEHHYTAERYDCDCRDDLLPGAFYPVEHDGDSSRAWVERCDNCTLFNDDHEAAKSLAAKLGVSWSVTNGGAGTPFLVDPNTGTPLAFGFGSKEVRSDV